MKTIKVSDEAYDALDRERQDNERFADVVDRRMDFGDRYLTESEIGRLVQEELTTVIERSNRLENRGERR